MSVQRGRACSRPRRYPGEGQIPGRAEFERLGRYQSDCLPTSLLDLVKVLGSAKRCAPNTRSPVSLDNLGKRPKGNSTLMRNLAGSRKCCSKVNWQALHENTDPIPLPRNPRPAVPYRPLVASEVRHTTRARSSHGESQPVLSCFRQACRIGLLGRINSAFSTPSMISKSPATCG